MNEFKNIAVKTQYLEFRAGNFLHNSLFALLPNVKIKKWQPTAKEYLAVYNRVGEKWGWSGRLVITEYELNQILQHPDFLKFSWTENHEIIGFAELEIKAQKAEIVYFGFIPEKTGSGRGKVFFSFVIHEFAFNQKLDLWLHTCQFDSKQALPFYKKMGFQVISEQTNCEPYPSKFIEQQNLKIHDC